MPRSMRLVREQSLGLHKQIESGVPETVARQHALGKQTARERLDLLLDPGSFTEIDMYC
jgi:acetyl-CoA carboxylase carboxyltransferase component